MRYTINMFLHPESTLEHLLIHEDWHIADLGAGSGAYTLAAAKLVPIGKVYAVDINRGILPFIKAKVAAHGHHNIEVIWGDIDRTSGTNLGDTSLDAVIIANTFFQFDNKGAAIREIKRILKPAGKVLFIEWSGSFGNIGPRETDVVLPEMAKSLFGAAGFVLKEEFPAGEYHYGMIFSKL